MGKKYLDTVERTNEFFYGSYGDYTITIRTETTTDGYDIEVIAPDGTYAYNGYWGEYDGTDTGMDAAIEEALRGSGAKRPKKPHPTSI